MKRRFLSPLAIALLGLATSHADQNDEISQKQRRAAEGAAAGPVTGAIIGDEDGTALEGAAIGAAAGGGAGYVFGRGENGEDDGAEQPWNAPGEGEGQGALRVLNAAGAADQPDNLHDAMEIIGKNLKKLRKLKADDWEGGAELVKKAREAAYLAIGMIPDDVLAIPDEKIKVREIANYQRLISLSYSQLCGLELAYRSQNAQAVETAKKAVFSTEKEGHDKYKPED